MNLKNTLTTLPQYLLPQHSLSKLMSLFTHCENPAVKNLIIRQIIQIYGVNMAEAADDNLDAYKSFNEFFTRALKAGVRPIDDQRLSVVSPADGVVSQSGQISDGRIFQAKGMHFSTVDLLGGNSERAKPFQYGLFSTIYLSPKDYHRLHMPLAGTLTEMVHIPGKLFSVNQATTESVPGLFARNERVACFFDTPAGPMALVLVGAIFVSSIETTWHGVVTPPTFDSVRQWSYAKESGGKDSIYAFKKGDEMGRFNMGSTIIVLFGKDAVQWNDDFTAGKAVKMGEAVGYLA